MEQHVVHRFIQIHEQFIIIHYKTLTNEDMELANKLYILNGIKPDQIDTLSQKNIHPYLWLDSHEKMNASSLPGREHFNQHVDQQKNDEDYDQGLKMFLRTFFFLREG